MKVYTFEFIYFIHLFILTLDFKTQIHWEQNKGTASVEIEKE